MNTHQTATQYKLRMPPEMHRDLKASAKANHRSLNAEIVHRLQGTLGHASPNKEQSCEAK